MPRHLDCEGDWAASTQQRSLNDGQPTPVIHPDVVVLTDKEMACLSWVAKGKSDWETGTILQISAKTVNHHIESAKRKYGVNTRIQAVVRAVRAGQI